MIKYGMPRRTTRHPQAADTVSTVASQGRRTAEAQLHNAQAQRTTSAAAADMENLRKYDAMVSRVMRGPARRGA